MSSAPTHPDVVKAASHGDVNGPQSDEERLMAIMLTTQWMLTTGRLLGSNPLLHSLGRDALVDFWADDHLDTRAHNRDQGERNGQTDVGKA